MCQSTDIILCESWRWLCDYIYGAGFTPTNLVPPEGIVCVALDEVCEFFKLIENRPERYIIVSPRSDYGLFYQLDYPPWKDLEKWLRMVASPKLGYHGISVAPRCDPLNCNINHKYAIRMYSWTKSTFHEIPSNVGHWFVANNGILDDPRISSIPFGVAGSKIEDATKYARNDSIQRNKFLYVNFGIHTYERYALLQYYKQLQSGWVTIVDKEKPFDEYWTDLQSHQYVLCPNGNGIDCYRTLESIYAGATPLVEINEVTLGLKKLLSEIQLCPNLMFTQKEGLPKQSTSVSEFAYMRYWSNRIEHLRGELDLHGSHYKRSCNQKDYI